MRAKSPLLLIICFLALAACQTTDSRIGKGPITLSSSATSMFENYKLKESPNYFVVANDGLNAAYSSCPPMGVDCVIEGPENVLFGCSERAKTRGTECSVFAVERKIVWKGPVSYRLLAGDYTAIIIVSDFGNDSNIYTGRGTVSWDKNIIELKFRNCVGEANLSTGNWSVIGCAKNLSAEGTLRAGKGKFSYYGYGKDRNGNNAEIKLIKTSAQPKMSSAGMPASMKQRSMTDKDICNGVKYGHPDSIAEAKRRGFAYYKCK
mgnify:CR=1 FL=1